MAPGRGGHDEFGSIGNSSGRRRPLSSKGSLNSGGGRRFDYDDDEERRRGDDECSRSSTDQEYEDDPELERSPSERELEARKNRGPMTPAEMRAARLASARRQDRQRANAPWYTKHQKALILSTLVCLSLTLVGLSVGLAVYFVKKGDNSIQGGVTDENASTGENPNSSPSSPNPGVDLSPYNEIEEESVSDEENEFQRKRKHRSDIANRLVLEGITSSADLITPGSPQNASLEWIAHHDPLALNPISETETWTQFVQRYVLAVLYFSLVPGSIQSMMDISMHSIYGNQSSNTTNLALNESQKIFLPLTTGSGLDTWLSSSSECEWDYVTCEEFLLYESDNDNVYDPSLLQNGEKNSVPPIELNGESSKINEEENPMFGMEQKIVHGPNRRSLMRYQDTQQVDAPKRNLLSGERVASSVGEHLTFLSRRFVKENEMETTIDKEAVALAGNFSVEEEEYVKDKYTDETSVEDEGQHLMPRIITLSLGDIRASTNQSTLDGLDDASNFLYGQKASMPSELGILTFLEGLNLSNLHWTGSIPQRLGDLVNLSGFVVTECPNLSGPLPESFSNLSNLQVLNVEGNNLNGTVPEYLQDLKELRHIKLANNSFSGELSPDLFFLNSAKLEWITLAYNNFEGDISPAICDLPSSVMVDLRDGIIANSLNNFSSTTDFEMDVVADPTASSTKPVLSDGITCTCCNL